jgi:hypothetical protein
MYAITFINKNKQLCSYVITADNLAMAMQIAKTLSGGNPVTAVII